MGLSDLLQSTENWGEALVSEARRHIYRIYAKTYSLGYFGAAASYMLFSVQGNLDPQENAQAPTVKKA